MKTPISKNFYLGRKITNPLRLRQVKSVYNRNLKRIEATAWIRNYQFWRVLENIKNGVYFEVKK